MSTITLGGTQLSGSLQWTDRYNFSSIAQTTERTLSGNLVIFNASLVSGMPITLEATQDTGWFTGAMVTAIRTMADTLNGTFALDWHQEESYNVKFMHDDPPAIQFTPLVGKVPQTGTDYFTGTIKLFTVS